LRLRLSEILPRLTNAVPRRWLVMLNRFPALRSWARSGVDVLTRRTTPAGVRPVVIPAGPLRGLRLVLDFKQAGERAIWLNTYEPWVQHKLVEVIRPGHLVFEVGAYIGTYALMIRRLGPGSRVIALEPDPRNRIRLQENLALNGADDVVVLPDAVGAEVATVSFTSAGMHGSIGKGDERVRTTTLDALVREYGTPDVVLIDIQGAEAAALEGGRELLQAGRTTWVVELHGDEGSIAAAALENAGYTLETPDPRSDVDRLLRRSGRTHVVARPLRGSHDPGVSTPEIGVHPGVPVCSSPPADGQKH
jgi:FkbM family methyltransferase